MCFRSSSDKDDEDTTPVARPAQATGRRTAAATERLRASQFGEENQRLSAERRDSFGFSGGPGGPHGGSGHGGDSGGMYGGVGGGVYSGVYGGANGGVTGGVGGGVYGTTHGGGAAAGFGNHGAGGDGGD